MWGWRRRDEAREDTGDEGTTGNGTKRDEEEWPQRATGGGGKKRAGSKTLKKGDKETMEELAGLDKDEEYERAQIAEGEEEEQRERDADKRRAGREGNTRRNGGHTDRV